MKKENPFFAGDSEYIESNLDFSIKQPSEIIAKTTPLHFSCSSSTPCITEMQTILNSDPTLVFVPDSDNRLPIHHLASNEKIFLNRANKPKVEAFVSQLLQAYPESILMQDIYFRIPFTEAIIQWINTVHTQTTEDTITVPDFIRGLREYNLIIPQHVTIPPLVEFGIFMLSSIIDKSNRETWREIVNHIASISFLLKTILLIEDDDVRSKLLNSTPLSRVIVEPKTAELGMIPMLKAQPSTACRCIEYFELVSNIPLRKYIGKQGYVELSDAVAFQEKRKAVFEAIGHSKYFIPSLCQLPKWLRLKASSTLVIGHIINHAVSDTFMRCTYITSVLMIISF